MGSRNIQLAMRRLYENYIKQYMERQGLSKLDVTGLAWRRIQINVEDAQRLSMAWNVSDDTSMPGAEFWLGGAHRVAAEGTLEFRYNQDGQLEVRNVAVTYTWYDEIDGNDIKEWLEKHPGGVWDGMSWDTVGRVLEFLAEAIGWDVLMDKLGNVNFRVEIEWTHEFAGPGNLSEAVGCENCQ